MTNEQEGKLDAKQLETFEGLCSIQCTLEEIAAVMKMSLGKIRYIIQNDPAIKAIWEQAPAMGRASLRRLQLRHARGFGPAAVAMTIHLSKHWLGETERSIMEHEHTVHVTAGDSAANLLLRGMNVDLLTKNEAVDLAKLCTLVDEEGIQSLSPRRRARFFMLINKAMPEENSAPEEPEEKPLLALPPPEKDRE